MCWQHRRAAGARGPGGRGDQRRPHLYRPRRPPHDGGARRQRRCRDRAQQQPVINFCKPAVDPLFASAAELWGYKTMALVLSGMGTDGLQRRKSDRRRRRPRDGAGRNRPPWSGACRAQVAHAGLCWAVLPLDEIGPGSSVCLPGGGHDRDDFDSSAACSRSAPAWCCARQGLSAGEPAAAGRAQAQHEGARRPHRRAARPPRTASCCAT